MPSLTLHQLRKSFGSVVAIDRLSLDLPPGSTLLLTGPSGSGKSTTLRLIAGLDSPDSGQIHFDSIDWSHRPPHLRQCGWMPQHAALLPHLTVADQLDLALRVHHVPTHSRQQQIQELAARLGIDQRLQHRPAQLSGGEASRVALARALLPKPSLLLLDEPFAHLDSPRRRDLRHLLRDLQAEHGFTRIEITHQPLEALPDASHLACLEAGQLVQFDSIPQVWAHPASPWIANSLAPHPICWIPVPLLISHPACHGFLPPPNATLLGLRSESITLHPHPPPTPAIGPLSVRRIGFLGADRLVELDGLDGKSPIEVPMRPAGMSPAPGQPLWLEIQPTAMLWFTKESAG